MKIKSFNILLIVCFHVFFINGFSDAELKMFPTRVILENGKKSATVTLINSGNATGVYEVSWMDREMNEDGSVVEWKEESPAPWSIRPFIRYAPRRVTLKPGEQQIVKIGIKRTLLQKEGEFYSHFRISMIDSNLESTNERMNAEGDSKKYSITIQPIQSVAIPVIWRSPKAVFNASLKTAVLDLENELLVLNIERKGKFSTRGFVSVFSDDSETNLTERKHVVIYPTVEAKEVRLKFLKKSDLKTLKDKNIRVEYVDELNKERIYFVTRITL